MLFKKKILFITVIGIAICFTLILTTRWHNQGNTRTDATYLSLLQEAYAAVNSFYVEKPDEPKVIKSMIDGMLMSLDPHSAYLPPEPYKEMETQITGAFGGVGIELGIKNGHLTVIAPIEGSPAYRAGVQPNDYIVKIDSTATQGMRIMDAVKRMRGEKGTAVTLTIQRNGDSRPSVVRLIRDTIKIKSLKLRDLGDGYGLIQISQFQERTGNEFRKALSDLKLSSGGEIKGLVLDLRFNPGGLLGSAVEVVNCFIGDDANNTMIVSIKGRTPDSNHEFHASLGQKEAHYPIVVLLNGGSASASEIVAGALQDHKRAIIMGRQSFGKGSVQSIYPLPHNAALKLTTAHYYTPSGRSIQAKGIIPDVEVGSGNPVENIKTKEMKFHENDLENGLAPAKHGAGGNIAPIPHLGSDPKVSEDNQLLRALELLRSLSLVREQKLVPIR
ncbi:S41 family peptidase [Pelotalea chapellei]|uniref:S41 family peptidase n=1 Tax=Pelotalea chapellei TaxID=44671 RepID=A0ABS5UCI0_9BACT|nr:S41 family peptidase [Pelotalea chapellei]MBT1073356.1 S41 family peptidase [Pelotalea chapellei]